MLGDTKIDVGHGTWTLYGFSVMFYIYIYIMKDFPTKRSNEIFLPKSPNKIAKTQNLLVV